MGNAVAKEVKETKLKVVEVDPVKKQLYKTVMKNLRPLYTVDGNVLTKSGDIPLDLLRVDDSYQGYRKHNRLNNLISNWDYRKLDLITVVPHDDTCTFAVVDGQGRTLAAHALKLDSLCAKVLMDAPSDPEERLKYEANIFVQQDDQQETLRAVEKHLAYSLVGNPAAIAMNNVMKKYHVEFVDGHGQRESRVLGSYAETFRIARVYGENCLEFMFSIIENAGWGDANNGYSTAIVLGLKNLYALHDTKKERESINDFLSEELRQYDPLTFIAISKSKYPSRDNRTAIRLYLEDMCVNAKLVKRAMYIDTSSEKFKVVNKKVNKKGAK